MSTGQPQQQRTRRFGSPAVSGTAPTPRAQQEILTIPPEWVGMKLRSHAELDAETQRPTSRVTPEPSTPHRHPMRYRRSFLTCLGSALALVVVGTGWLGASASSNAGGHRQAAGSALVGRRRPLRPPPLHSTPSHRVPPPTVASQPVAPNAPSPTVVSHPLAEGSPLPTGVANSPAALAAPRGAEAPTATATRPAAKTPAGRNSTRSRQPHTSPTWRFIVPRQDDYSADHLR